jgi:ADP-heptose:LPS heptosyltransferase
VTAALVPEVAKIAVLRANSLGDLLFAVPALDALRAAYPGAEIVLLGKPWHADFVVGRVTAVDRVVVAPDVEGTGTGDEGAFFARMGEERFDLALQLHGGGRNSNPFVRRLGARVTAGLRTPDAEPLDRWVPYVYYQSEVFRLLEAVATVGASTCGLEPRLSVLDEDRREVDAAVGDDGRPLVALHPGASEGRRRWPAECFSAVGDALAAAGARVLVTGTSAEANLVDEVVAAMDGAAVGLAGRLSVAGVAALLSRCAVVVSNDTGPLHVAAAVRAATVGIYWCGNLINAGPLTRTRHRPAVSWRLDCPVCGTNCVTGSCRHDASFVADVAVDEVRASALDLWSTALQEDLQAAVVAGDVARHHGPQQRLGDPVEPAGVGVHGLDHP